MEDEDLMKGKHGQSAAVRRTAQEQAEVVAEYEQRVARLTSKVAELEARNTQLIAAQRERVARLEAQLNDATSDELQSVGARLAESHEAMGEMRTEVAKIRKLWESVVRNLADYLVAQGMSGHEAMEKVLELAGGKGSILDGSIPETAGRKLSSSARSTLRKVRER